ncbi:MAG: hypothetical protein WD080_09930 [Egibacteraceae bacterium]
MTQFRRKAAPFAAAAAAALALAACGTDDEAPPTDDVGMEEPDDADVGQTDDPEAPSEFAVDITSTGDPFADAKAAAHHVKGAAQTLAGGIATAAAMEGDPNSGASELRASLTGLLQEHVYLAGFAVDTAYGFGPDSGEFELAAAALDENSVELADLVGSAAGPDNREAFLELWRQHIGFFVDYAVAQAGGDQEARQTALDSLEGYTGDAGAFFESITGGELPADAVAQSLQGHIATLTAAIDGFAAGDAGAFDALKGAADHVVGGAAVLAGGIATAIEADGDTESQASQLRSGLTAGLQEHVYLAGLAVKTAYAEGADSPAFEAAAATLDANSVELADGIGQVAGDENREAFLELWRQHIGFFVDYAVATAGGDQQAQAQAIEDLAGYTGDAGAFFENISGGELPADAVAEGLRGHISTLAGAIDSLNAAINS